MNTMEVYYVAIRTEGLGSDGKYHPNFQYVSGPHDNSSAKALAAKFDHDQKRFDPYLPRDKMLNYVTVGEVKNIFEA
jgi:hypothetical protein